MIKLQWTAFQPRGVWNKVKILGFIWLVMSYTWVSGIYFDNAEWMFAQALQSFTHPLSTYNARQRGIVVLIMNKVSVVL